VVSVNEKFTKLWAQTYLLCDDRLCEEPRSEPSVEHRVLPAEYFSLSSTHINTLHHHFTQHYNHDKQQLTVLSIILHTFSNKYSLLYTDNFVIPCHNKWWLKQLTAFNTVVWCNCIITNVFALWHFCFTYKQLFHY